MHTDIIHPRLTTSARSLKEAIFRSTEDLILLIGPSGVGKTHLVNKVTRQIAAKNKNPAHLPVVSFRLRQYTERFNWSSLLRDLLRETGHASSRSNTLEAAWSKIALAQSARQTRVVFIDEATPLFCAQSAVMLENNRTVIRRIGPGAKVVLIVNSDVLAGLARVSSQSLRRLQIVPFHRYTTAPRDMRTFRSLLARIDATSSPRDLKLSARPQQIYNGCGGFVGILLTWLEAARRQSTLKHRTPILTAAALARTRLPDSELALCLRQALLFERQIPPTGWAIKSQMKRPAA